MRTRLLLFLLTMNSLSASDPVVAWTEGSLRPLYDPGDDFYSYSPSVIRDGDVELYWSCHNREANVVRDYIYYFERRGGEISEGRPVLGPGPAGAWDSFHVCDPAVVQGEFGFEGESYRYAMFYLGNDVDASLNNQIGVAFTNEIDGEWIRYPEPIVAHIPSGTWGVGQPSVVSIDGKGRVLVFFTRGHKKTGGFCQEIDLTDMTAPRVGKERPVTNNGLTRLDGTPDYLNNFDIVYDPTRDRFFAIRGQRPYETSEPTYISPRLEIISIPSAAIWRGRGRWRSETLLIPEITGHARNHNAGIERTLHGHLPDPTRLHVVFATACAAGDCEDRRPLWTYSLWEIEGKILLEQGSDAEKRPPVKTRLRRKTQ